MSLTDKTIPELLRHQVNINPNGIALEFEDKLFTWSDIEELSEKSSIGLHRSGIRSKKHVGILSINTPSWIITFFAILKLGAVPVLLNNCYKEKELAYVIKSTDIEFLCYGDGYKERDYANILFNSTQIEIDKNKLISIGKGVDGQWHGLIEKPRGISDEDKTLLEQFRGKVDSKDTAAILFTSGTSMRPKGVVLTHHSLVNNAIDIATSMKWTNKDKLCIAVPLFHCFGVTASLLASTYTGLSMHLLSYYKTFRVLEKIEKYKCTILNGVPSMFLAMINNPCFDNFDISSLESGVIAGSSISRVEYKNIVEKTKIGKLQPSYGQTETSPCITIAKYNDDLEIKSTSAGKKLDTVSLRIMKTNENKEVGVNELGEIQTKGYHLMKGYYNQNDETQAVFTQDGWLKTGDLGYLDPFGNLHITSRLNEMIIRGGENIFPKEIEEEIMKLEDVKNVKVIGVSSKVLQEEIAACIVLKDNHTLDKINFENHLLGQLNRNLSDYKIPKYIIFFEEFPLSTSGKILTGRIKEEATEVIKQKYKLPKKKKIDCKRISSL